MARCGRICGMMLLFWGEWASGHAFGEAYKLPLPLHFYLISSSLVLVLSFLLMGALVGKEQSAFGVVLTRFYQFQKDVDFVTSFWNHLIFFLRVIGVVLFAVVFYASWFGTTETFRNFAPVFVWVVWWVGLSLFSAIVGNIWPVLDPWRNIGKLIRAFLPAPKRSSYVFPECLSGWLAIFSFLLFSTSELIWGVMSYPRAIGVLIVFYSFFTWSGYAVFGIEAWIKHADPLAKMFSVLGEVAIFDGRQGRIRVRLPGFGAVSSWEYRMTDAVFVILMLATISFDGVLEVLPDEILNPGWVLEMFLKPVFPDASPIHLAVYETKVTKLVVYLMVFFSWWFSFYGANSLSQRLQKNRGTSVASMVRNSVRSLIPIAVAYHFAHYLGYLLITGQYMIALISDPFGFGWNIFGTRHYQNNIGVITAQVAWYLSLGAIMLGHVLSLCIAHLIVQRTSSHSEITTSSQIPMLLVMIVYTVVGLWLLAQPITV